MDDTRHDRKSSSGINTYVSPSVKIKRKPLPKQTAPSKSSWNTIPHTLILLSFLLSLRHAWAARWLLSGAPILSYCILLGRSHGHRILPFIPLWTLFSTLHLVYAVFATSWLLYWVFLSLCYPCTILCCLFQFDYAAELARTGLRKLLADLHFFNDKVAFFDLPALEFDTRSKGLMVVRGVTLSLSTLTLVAHGVEVAVKLSEDMELAIQVDEVTVGLFRNVEIGDVYANVKGGEWEMTFGTLAPELPEEEKDSFLVRDTPILRAAQRAHRERRGSGASVASARSSKGEREVKNASEALGEVTQLSPDETTARRQYRELLDEIYETSTITTTMRELKDAAREEEEAEREREREAEARENENENDKEKEKDKDKKKQNEEKTKKLDVDNINDLRAAIAAEIQHHPSIPHPPKRSIRLSTLRKTSYPRLMKFLHRLPLLYRLLLNPIAYFHPVSVKSVTTAGSGKWFKLLMRQYFFKHYSTQDQEIRRLEARISKWVSDANFSVELVDLFCTAQVPVNTKYDIECRFKVRDVMAYRVPPKALNLTQVVRVGGADATVTLPIYLFPHHEHIFPRKATEEDIRDTEREVEEFKDTPLGLQAQMRLEELLKDEANMHVAVHAHLPARIHQDLLNFTAALVKASKVIENDKDFEELKSLRETRRNSVSGVSSPKPTSRPTSPSGVSELSDTLSISSTPSTSTLDTVNSDLTTPTPSTLSETPTTTNKPAFKSFLQKIDTGLREAKFGARDTTRKLWHGTASAVANDRWIAKMVGKLLRKLERARGEVGYAVDVKLGLEEWRVSPKWEDEGKILP